MARRLGFIGAGNMVSAMLHGILTGALALPGDIWLSNRSPEKLERWRAQGVHTTLDNAAVAQQAELLVLGVKPQSFEEVLPQIAPHCAGRCVLSIAAGISTAYLRERLPGAQVIRAIPNTPLQVGKGATVVAQAPQVEPELFRLALSLFQAAGTVAVIPESQMDDFIAVSGSSPAFFFRLAAVMVDEAAKAGIDPETALSMAAQTMAGSAAMLLESGKSPQELERQVCSPGGTTLAALSAFQEFRFEEMYHEAALRCAQRSRELGK